MVKKIPRLEGGYGDGDMGATMVKRTRRRLVRTGGVWGGAGGGTGVVK